MKTSLVTGDDISRGLRALELDSTSHVLVHSSLRSFGFVEEGATAVCRALMMTCGTVMMPAFTFDLAGLPFAPPELRRPLNAFPNAGSWDEFDASVQETQPFRADAPADEDMGTIPETFRQLPSVHRSTHPVMSFAASGSEALPILRAQQLASPLAPIQALTECDGDVLLLGVGHWSNTTIHLGEQRSG